MTKMMAIDEVIDFADDLVSEAIKVLSPDRILGLQGLIEGCEPDIAIHFALEDAREGLWTVPARFLQCVSHWKDLWMTYENNDFVNSADYILLERKYVWQPKK
jgi:hypothetical protein